MRTTSAGLQALRGLSEPGATILLVAIAGVGYYSSSSAVTYGGNTYVANRVKSIGSFEAMYVDRKVSHVSSVSIVLDNLADNGSSSFPFTVLDASINYEDRVVTIYAYSTVANDALIVWSGFAQRPNFDGVNKLVTLSASHFWVALDMPAPSKLAHQSGFNPTAVASTSNDNLSAESAIPLVWGVDNFKIRPLIYRTRVDGSVLRVNFIVSGTQSGAPFNAADVIAANVKLFNVTPASTVQFFTGGADSSVAPVNLTKFPDGVSHALVSYGYAEFPITNEQKDQIDNLQPDDIKMTIVNGRPLVDTAIPSENAALILKDFLRDPNFSIGLPNAIFDSTVLTSTANYVGTRYQVRYELHEQKSVAERVQQLLADFHGFITFDNGLIQIRCKKNSEASVATFATIDGGSGRKIHDDVIKSSYEKDASEVLNQVTVDYRLKKRNNRTTTLYDPNAQVRAGLTYKKVVEDKFELLGLFDETQVQINAAIIVREEQNGNLYIEFESPFWDCIDVSPGDIITVLSPDIPNNGSNYLFRVVGQSIDADSSYLVTFKCQVYKSAVYNDDASALGVDLLRGGSDTSQQGRPPDVTPVSLNIVDIVSSDTQGKTATLRGVWTYPTVDLTTEQAEGTFREYPIAQVDLFWHYTDESINAARLGASAIYPTAQVDFQIDYYKSRSVRCFFVAIGHNRARSPLGYIPDPAKTTFISGNLSATAAATFVGSSTGFAVNDLAFIEKELVKVVVVTGGGSPQLNFDPNTSPRNAFFDTVSIAHPSGTEISVAKLSYPSLIKALNVPRFTYPAVSAINVRQRPDGVKIKITDVSAENVEDYFIYWSITADPGAGSATPSWYTTDPLTPAAGINKISGKALHQTIPQEDIGAAGTIVYVRVAARNGKQNWSTALSPVASSAVGDDAVPVANQPRVVPKKHGLRVVEPMPTVNMKTFALSGKVEVVIQGKDGGGASLGYLTDATGTDLTSTGSEYKFDLKLANSATYPISKESTLALWPTAATLNIYIYVTNAVGTSAASTSRTVTVSTWEIGDLPIDTILPVAGTPLIIPKPLVIRVKCPVPTSNFNQFVKNEIVIRAFHGATTDGYIQDSSGDYVNAGGSEVAIDVGPTINPTFNIQKAQIQTLFPSATSLEFHYHITNGFGRSTAHTPVATMTISSWSVDPVAGDVAVPSGLSAPTIDWTAAGRLRIRGMVATTDIHTAKKKDLVVYNGSTTYLDIVNRTTAASEAAARFEFGRKSHLILADIKKKIYKNVFGASGNVLAYWYDENDLGVSSKSADSNTLNVANFNEILSDSRDSVNVVDIGVTLTGYRNECVNGDFVFDDGVTASVLNYWIRGTLGGTTNTINTTVANGVYWDQANHALNWRDKNQQLFQNQKKRFTRNDYRSVTFIAKVIGGNVFSSGTLDILVVNADGTICTVVGSGINLSDLTSSFQPFGVTFQFDNTTDFNAQKYLRLSLTSPVPDPGATREIVLDKIMQNRGKQGASYTPRSNAEEGPGSTIANAENLNITSTGTSSQDLYQPSGAGQGGWPGIGLGSVLTPGTL